MRKILLVCVSLIFSLTSFAQEVCGTENLQERYFQQFPEQKNKSLQDEIQLQRIIQQKKRTQQKEEEIYTVPVVVHVLHLGETEGTGSNLSDEKIHEGIRNLNNAYRNVNGTSIDTKIQFVLAKQDENCQLTTGIVRVNASSVAGYYSYGVKKSSSFGASDTELKDLSKWNTKMYYNIWVVSEIDNNNGGSGTAGYAYYPSSSGFQYDGTVIMASTFSSGGTLPHELGHALNLRHTFQDATKTTCPTNDDCTLDGDFCCDTEPHKQPSSSCPTGLNSCTNQAYGDVVYNFMNYTSCDDRFTPDQKLRMRTTMETMRSSLLNSKALSKPISFQAPKAINCTPTTSITGLNGGYAGITNVKFNTLNYSSGSTKSDGGSLDLTSECGLVTYIQPSQTYDLSVTSYYGDSDVKAWIDYNNDGTFSTDELLKSFQVPSQDEATVNVTIPSKDKVVLDTPLRMRVVLDRGFESSLTDACSDLQYGQAEDYTVYITSETLPVPQINFSKNEVCIGDTLFISDITNTNILSRVWEANNGQLSSITDSSNFIVFDKEGTQEITLSVTSLVGKATKTFSVKVNGTKVTFDKNFETSFTPTDSSVTLTFGKPTGGTYEGFGVTNNVFDPQAINKTSVVTYTYTDINACTATLPITFKVGYPTVKITADTNVCVGDTVFFTSKAKNDVSYWSWSFTGSSISNDSKLDAPYAIYNLAGTYSVRLYTVNFVGSNYEYVTIHVNDPIQVNGMNLVQSIKENESSITLTNDLIQHNGNKSLSGTFSGTGITNNVFTPSEAGVGVHEISYNYTDENNCKSVTKQSIEVIAALSLQELEGVDNVVIGPNPFESSFNLSFNNQTGNIFNYQLVNTRGQVIQDGVLSGETIYQLFDLSTQPSGLYYLVLSNGYQQKTISVIKQ